MVNATANQNEVSLKADNENNLFAAAAAA